MSIRPRRRARFVRVRHRPRPPSPLSRANRPAKHTTHRRGGGAGGGGTTSCRPSKHHRHSHPVKRNSGASPANVWRQPHGGSAASTTAGRTRPGSPITAKQWSQANVWRQPHGGSAASTPAGRTCPGSPITAKQNHRNTRQNAAFASPSHPARVHQPADAGRSPSNTRALPKPASSRTRTTQPRRSFVDRSNRFDAIGFTNTVLGGNRFVRERGCVDRGPALTAWEDGGSAVLQVRSLRAGPCANRPATHSNRHPRMSTPRAINPRTKQP